MGQEKPSKKSGANGSAIRRLAFERHDWSAARAEYINNAGLSLDDVAARYGIHPSNIRKRAGKENWSDAKAERAAKLLQKVTEKSVLNTAEELAKYNEDDLRIAKALRALVARQMQGDVISSREAIAIRALASAVESAQRVARLALGASTENPGEPDLISHLKPEDLSDAELELLDRILIKIGAPERRSISPPGNRVIQ